MASGDSVLSDYSEIGARVTNANPTEETTYNIWGPAAVNEVVMEKHANPNLGSAQVHAAPIERSIPTQHGPIKSYASIIHNNNKSNVVKVQVMTNEEQVEGAAVAIPLEAVEAVSSRFANTLYGYFVGKRLAFPLVENYVKNAWAKYGLKRVQCHEDFFLFQFNSKAEMERVLLDGPWMIRSEPMLLNVWTQTTKLKKDEIKSVPVWVKLHHVPIVAYSEVGLSLIATQIGKPIMLDSYTSSMCANSWGRNNYARVLIEVSAIHELKKDLIVAIPVGKDLGHSLATISIEYEWTPPRCSTCLIFDHPSAKCPKLPKPVGVAPLTTTEGVATSDGFQNVKKKRNKKRKSTQQVVGVVLNKPTLNLQYRKVERSTKTTIPMKARAKPPTADPGVSTSNKYNVLDDEADIWGNNGKSSAINESDSDEVDAEVLVIDKTQPKDMNTEGASTPISNVFNV